MKKTIFSLLFLTSLLIANESNWPFVCEPSDLDLVRDNRYFKVAASADGSLPLILADAQTMTIDKKNKTIKVWTIWFASEQGRLEEIKAMGQYNDYSNYGYVKELSIVNYKAKKLKTLSSTSYNCDGSVIFTNNSQRNWDDIIPDSVMEGIVKTLVERYKLK